MFIFSCRLPFLDVALIAVLYSIIVASIDVHWWEELLGEGSLSWQRSSSRKPKQASARMLTSEARRLGKLHFLPLDLLQVATYCLFLFISYLNINHSVFAPVFYSLAMTPNGLLSCKFCSVVLYRRLCHDLPLGKQAEVNTQSGANDKCAIRWSSVQIIVSSEDWKMARKRRRGRNSS